jgi:hypothetical protein
LNRFQEDGLVKDALSKGIDLREYAKQVDKDLSSLEYAHIQDCKLMIASISAKPTKTFVIDENQSETLQSLNNQIQVRKYANGFLFISHAYHFLGL